jgi:GTP pyrophosphokinase
MQKVDAVLKNIQDYSSLNTKPFEAICRTFLAHRKRKTFDLNVQTGLQTLIELHADITTLSAFILFQLPLAERKKVVIDEHVAHLMKGLDGLRDITSLGKIQENQSAEAVRKMFLAMSKDLRVVLVLMAYRYAELFELDQISPALRKKIAWQTLEIFVPIAGRLGIYTMKRKLEDRCFSFLLPNEYKALQSAFDQRQELHDETVAKLVASLTDFLQKNGVSVSVSGRVKGNYSTYIKQKQKGGGTLDDVYDLLALRVIVEKVTDCYTVLSLVNNHWQAISGRFKDYIAMPKANGYRSLHTVVVGMIEDAPRPVEIQIRTLDMHREAEYGIAAHWWYEEENIKKNTDVNQFVGRDRYEEKLQWLKNLVSLQDALGQESEPGKNAFDFFSDRIFVMTLTGIVIELPKGATPLDFAYAISESLGHHCARARVNGKIVSLDYELGNGDRVFVDKKMEVQPNLYWLSMVKTELAKNAIRKWLMDQGEDSLLEQGIRLVNRVLRQFGQEVLDRDFSLLKSIGAKELPFSQRRAMLIDIAQGDKEVEEIIRGIISEKELKQRQEKSQVVPLQKKDEIMVAGESHFKTKVAACCAPVFGDAIIGYTTRGGFISIHRTSCKVLASLERRRRIDAWWVGEIQQPRPVQIEVLMNTANLLAPLSQSLKQRQMNLLAFQYHKKANGYALVFDVELMNEVDLPALLSEWRAVKGVVSAVEKRKS